MRRPPVKLLVISSAAVLSLSVVGAGLARAAFHEEPVNAPIGGQKAVPAAGTVGSCGTVAAEARRDLRGMWLTTVLNIDFPARKGSSQAQVKAEYQRWLDLAVQRRHNAIFVHVRPSGDAFWESAYAPWSEWLTGKRDGQGPGWDPMAYMIEEAHKRNLEFHAWFNPYRGTQPGPEGPGDDFSKLAPNHPLVKHRDWAVSYPDGERARLYFNPGIPAARKFVEDAMMEAVEKYDVDGVHFDDFFYPYPEGGDNTFHDQDAFQARADKSQSLENWRRDNVNTMVREMHERIRKTKPWVKFGISPFGIWRNKTSDPKGSDSKGLESYSAQFADTRTWVKEGWLDYVVPQLYWTIGNEKADYAKLLPWWEQTVKGTDVQLYIGMADYRVGEDGGWKQPDQLARQMELNDRHGVQGTVHYSAKQVRANRLGAVDAYVKRHDNVPALPPTMRQLPVKTPDAPTLLTATRTDKGPVIVNYKRADGGADPVSWALYRVDGVTGDKANLVATGRVGAQDVADPAPPAGDATYCVSLLDRSSNESPLSDPVKLTSP
jgi:uncharacterized lipoprotein YddW (UPF0748 family)